MVMPFREDTFRAPPRPVLLLSETGEVVARQEPDSLFVPSLLALAAFCALMAYSKSRRRVVVLDGDY